MRIESRWLPALASVIVLALFGAVLLTSDAGPVREFAFVDFFDYYYAGDAVASGADPYDFTRSEALATQEGVPVIHRSPYIYPAWFAVVMTPLSVLPPWWAAAAWYLLSVAALVWTVRDGIERLGLSRLAWPAAVLFPPTLFTLFVGQINTLLLMLLWIAWSRRESRPVAAGIALGLAISVKLNPILLVLPLLAARRHRVILVAAATGFACLAVGELASPGSTMTFVSRVLPEIASIDARHAHPVNQGLKGFFLRMFVANPWTQSLADSTVLAGWAVRISSGLLGLALAVLAAFRGREREGAVWSFAIGVMIAVSPLAWESLFAIALLPMALLWRSGYRVHVALAWLALLVQRGIDDFANHPDAHSLLRAVPPLSSIALGGLMVLLASTTAAAARRHERGV